MKKILLRVSAIILLFTVSLSVVGLLFVSYIGKGVDYDFDEMLFKKAQEESTTYYYAYDRNNNPVEVWKNFGNGRREWISLSDVSEDLINGFISVEDRDFYSHKGINVKRTLAAVINHIFHFRQSFGASTITQQVIKNISGDNQGTVRRKLNEILRAVHLERNHSKDEILELYLNIVPMSDNMYGVAVAAEAYFGKEASELTLSEAATIIGITNAPSKYSPYLSPEECVAKRNRVLYAMYDYGVISEEDYRGAIELRLNVNEELTLPGISSWFVETARADIINDLANKNGISESAARLMLNGARVVMTMSPEIQNILENFFGEAENLSDKFREGMNYSMVVSDPKSGNLLGIIGNGGKKNGEQLYNYATQPITPGSTLKPLAIYAPLIDMGKINWSQMVEDTPVRYLETDTGSEIPYPKNSPDVYDGFITVSEAIKKSKNTVAIRLLQLFGADNAFDLLKNKYGFKNLVDREVLSDGKKVTDRAESPLALGQLTRGVSLRKLTESYNVFPNKGVLTSGSSYYAVFSREGKLLIESEKNNMRLFKEETADIMNQLLLNVVKDGTAKAIKLKDNVDTAGKTGTSGGDKDRIFVGYTPYYTAGIWCGYSGNKNNSVGANTPSHLQIWDRVMTEIHNELVFDGYEEEVLGFDTINLLVQPYCSRSGCLPGENCELDDEAHIEYGYFSRNNCVSEICGEH